MIRTFAFIFARGGSKGLPGKNIKMFSGKPLIGHAIDTALATGRCEDVIISTDSDEIASVARSFGARVPFMRPADLATDTAPEWKAWQHAIDFVKETYGPFETFVSLPTTSPLRAVSDVHRCLDELEKNPDTDIVITGCEAKRSPYFNMVKVDKDGFVQVVNNADKRVVRRQDAPKVYDVTTVAYAARPEFVLRSNSPWDGAVRMVEVPAERAVDIDTPLDFAFAEYLSQHPLSEAEQES